MEKIKSRVSLVRAAQHNTRERMPPNADEQRTKNNWTNGDTATVIQRYTELLPNKVRKDAVHAVEFVFTMSPGWSGDHTRYLNDCTKWAQDLFGPDNLLHVAHHHDETTPHCHVLIMPIFEGKLNCKHFLSGGPSRLSELQTDFYEKVGKPHRLERGVSKAETKARHRPHTLAVKAEELDKREKKQNETQRLQEDFNSSRIMGLKDWKLPEPAMFETAKKYKQRITPKVEGKIVALNERDNDVTQKLAEAIKIRQENTKNAEQRAELMEQIEAYKEQVADYAASNEDLKKQLSEIKKSRDDYQAKYFAEYKKTHPQQQQQSAAVGFIRAR